MLLHWIWLAHRPGLSDRGRAALLQRFQDPEDIFYADRKTLAEVEGLSGTGLEALGDKSLDEAQSILKICRDKKLGILTFQDAAYPRRLRNISDPPAVLYYKGQIPDLDSCPAIAVVGTRKASAYGLTTAKRMGYQIARCGGIVVSGMAYGIDGMATAGALTAGSPAVGVLGCGVDVVYPMSNRSLFRDMEEYGWLVSEFPPGYPPSRWTFPKRNRIISGMCNGVLVIEAPEKSGSLITARQAAEQRRDVFAVPGNIDLPSFQGSNQLLRDGAIMVSSGWEVVSEYEGLYPNSLRKELGQCSQTAYPEEVQFAADSGKQYEKVAQDIQKPKQIRNLKKKLDKIDKKDTDNTASSPYSVVDTDSIPLSDEERSVIQILEQGERLVDDVIAQTGLPAGKLLSLLTMMELKGVVRRLPGKRIALQIR